MAQGTFKHIKTGTWELSITLVPILILPLINSLIPTTIVTIQSHNIMAQTIFGRKAR